MGGLAGEEGEVAELALLGRACDAEGMFRQPLPPSQNTAGTRPARANAEAMNAPGNFPVDAPYDAQAGVPSALAGGVYKDDAQAKSPPAVVPSKSWPQSNADPAPFANLRSR